MDHQQAMRLPQKKQAKSPASSPRQTLLNHVKTHPLLEFQRTIGNQAVLNILLSRNMQTDTTAQAFVELPFSHDFSRIPVHSTQTAVPQTKLAINQPGDVYEQEADQVVEKVMYKKGDSTQGGGSSTIIDQTGDLRK